jgi:hypothetical protein
VHPNKTQVRPNEHVRFKQISLEQAFAAISRTDALVDTLTAVARGQLGLQQAEKQLAAHQVRVGCCCARELVTPSHRFWVPHITQHPTRA